VPPALLQFVPMLRNVNINPSLKGELMQQIESILSGSNIEEELNSLFALYSVTSVSDVVVQMLTRDDRFRDSVGCIMPEDSKKTFFIDFYKTLFTALINFYKIAIIETPAHNEARSATNEDPYTLVHSIAICTSLRRSDSYLHSGSPCVDLCIRLFADMIETRAKQFEIATEKEIYLSTMRFQGWSREDSVKFMSDIFSSIITMNTIRIKKTLLRPADLQPYLTASMVRFARKDIKMYLPKKGLLPNNVVSLNHQAAPSSGPLGDLGSTRVFVKDRGLINDYDDETALSDYYESMEMAQEMEVFKNSGQDYKSIDKKLVCPLGDLDTMSLETLATFKGDNAIVITYSTQIPDFVLDLRSNVKVTVFVPNPPRKREDKWLDTLRITYFLMVWGKPDSKIKFENWHKLEHEQLTRTVARLRANCCRHLNINGGAIPKNRQQHGGGAVLQRQQAVRRYAS